MNVAINGFGRTGRMFYRAFLKGSYGFDVVAINDLTDSKTLAWLLKRDSVHGTIPNKVEAGEGFISVDGKKLSVYGEKDPAALPWKDLGVDCVIESTGRFRKPEDARKHVEAGARKVVISAPAKGEPDATLVLGINESDYDPAKHDIMSMASCTTNCLAPVCKVLQESFGLDHGFMTTVHAYTNDQLILDSPHKDLRRSRAAAVSIIPTTTGAAKAIGLVMPELKGRLDGLAFRVPVADASIIDLTVELAKEATAEEINAAFKKAAEGSLKGLLEYSEEPLVSCDIIGNPHSAILDSLGTSVLGGGKSRTAKVLAWYDNECGYSTRLADFAEFLSKKE